MENNRYLKQIKHEASSDRVCDWLFVQLGKDIRVYYKNEPEAGNGFLFYALELIGFENNDETKKEEWHPEYTFVQCFYHGIAYFDGIRHLYMGDEKTGNEGYHYYPNIESNIKTLQAIRELEIKFCSEYE